MRKVISAIVFSLVLSSFPAWAADNYKIDPVHSTIGFSVKHMMVSNTKGEFTQYDGKIIYDPNDLDNSKIDVSIQTASIDTRNEKRDEHLKSPDFFDVSKFPLITFSASKITATEIIGQLTIKGITKQVTIPATISGPVSGMGMTKIGINGSFLLNRQDYGITFNKTLDQGGLAVGDDVTVNISIEADKQESPKETVVPDDNKK